MTRPDDDREVPESEEPDDHPATQPESLPLEAEPADVLEQAQAVPAEEDEYR